MFGFFFFFSLKASIQNSQVSTVYPIHTCITEWRPDKSVCKILFYRRDYVKRYSTVKRKIALIIRTAPLSLVWGDPFPPRKGGEINCFSSIEQIFKSDRQQGNGFRRREETEIHQAQKSESSRNVIDAETNDFSRKPLQFLTYRKPNLMQTTSLSRRRNNR